jgi:glycerate-2-kinase
LRADLRAILDRALRACDPGRLLIRALAAHALPADVPLVICAAGKAARPMADAFVRVHAHRTRDVHVATGAHPVPDVQSVASAERALALAAESRVRGDRLVVLLSGGASSMLAMPAAGVPFEDKRALTALLLRSGLPIDEMNAVRKHVSAIKGGQLAAAAGASTTFALSDVHGPREDDPAVIGSGPTVADPTTFADAERALRAAGLLELVPASIRDRLSRGVRGDVAETTKPGDPRLAAAEFVLAGSRRDAMDGARDAAIALGYDVECVGPALTGEAAVAGASFVDRARAGGSSTRPRCLIASGETTVTLPLSGVTARGGRNQELALSAAAGVRELGVAALASAGTDGIDGPTDAAGAVVDSLTLARAEALGLDPAAALAAHDSYRFFEALGDLIITGPTHTNVGDLQILLLAGSARAIMRS